MSCIFCQIAAGEVPAEIVFENAQFVAFLDIHPIVVGHTLVIPKKHYRWVHEVEEFGPYWEAAQKVARAQLQTLGAQTVIFATAGFQVPHAHIHVMPVPPCKRGEILPGVESARRLDITPVQLRRTADALALAIAHEAD